MALVNKVEIKPVYRTDHSSVELELKLSDLFVVEDSGNLITLFYMIKILLKKSRKPFIQ